MPSEQDQPSQPDREGGRDAEERLPASYAAKHAIYTAIESYLPAGVSSEEYTKRQFYKTADGRRVVLNNGRRGHGSDPNEWEYSVTEKPYDFGQEGRDYIEHELVLKSQQLDLYKTDWPGKSIDEPDKEVSEAEARQILEDLKSLQPVEQ